MMAWEWRRPRRARVVPRKKRWPAIFGLTVVDTVLLRLVFPAAAAGAALEAEHRGWGLLQHIELPAWVAGALAFVVLDFVVWLTHVLMHAVPVLWRVHRVHHTDLDLDALSGLRFHPIEILLSMGVKFGAIFALGAPVVAVIVFEVVLNAAALFNHSNASLPGKWERLVRLVLVTPDMHRVHHSVNRDEHNRNFGFFLPLWDRVFRLYQAQPREGHVSMSIGLTGHRDPSWVVALPGLLLLPFRRRAR